MNMKYIAVFACIIMAGMMIASISPVKASGPALMNQIQYKFYGTQDDLFTALISGDIDVMGWPLTHAEYTTITTPTQNLNIQVEPLPEAGEFELAFNNNYTDGVVATIRSPMNYTDFRNALNCLVDEQGVINAPILGGFATRDYTQIPQPLMAGFVNPAVSGSNYPWAYNVTHALQILWNGNWYNHAIYPTVTSLVTTELNGSLAGRLGSASGVVYSGNDPNGQWGGGDPLATADSALANTPLSQLVGYVRSNDGRHDLGDLFCANLLAIGCPYQENLKATLTALRPYVLDAQTYDFATLGYSMSAPPNWFYSELTPVGIYSGGPNPYLVQDSNMTNWATQMFEDPTQASYQIASNNVQDIMVMESELVSVYTPATYCAYRTGLLGQIDELGYGTQGTGQLMNWITLDTRKTNTIVYNGNSPPQSNIINFGEYNPPDQLNPIFSDEVFDFQVLDEIFTYPLAANPYNDIVPGSAITGFASGSDLPWMAYYWNTTLIPAQDGSGGQWTNVTVWFRNDITWQDGVPFTVYDWNYTIWANAVYGLAYDQSGMAFCTNASNNYLPYFTAHGNYCASVLVTNPSWLSLYTPMYEIVPQHLYSNIIPLNLTAAEAGTSTDGLVGLWPGQSPSNGPGNVIANAYFDLAKLQSNASSTLVGCGPWSYLANSFTGINAGDGITLTSYSGFFFYPAPGAIAFKYTWINTAGSNTTPSGGYYRVGLSDLVLLANAYGTVGTPANVSISSTPGLAHTWNPACDLAAPSCVIGLSDLVTLALHYGWYYGNYSYSPTNWPSSEPNPP